MENDINIVPPVQPEPMPVQPKPKTRLIVLLVVLGVVIVGYFVLAKFLNVWPFEVPVLTPAYTPRPTLAPTYTPHPTTDNQLADWQTYRNEKYGFEFKYPRNWVPNSGVRSEPDSPKIFTTGFGDTRNPFRSVFIVIYSKQQAPEKSEGQIFYFPGGRGVIVENKWLLAEKDGIVIQVWPTHESEDKGFINQILSTFKFIESVP